MKPTWLRVDGLRTRLVLVFIAIVVVIAGATAGAVSYMARSWIYSNAQDVAAAQFRDEVAPINGQYIDGLTPENLAQHFQSDMTVFSNGEILQYTLDPSRIPPSFSNGRGSITLMRFERLDSERILLGMSVEVTDTSTPDSSENPTVVTAVAVRPLIGVQDKFNDLLRVVGLTLTLGVLISGLLGFWIASTLVRPLKRLDEAASRAADGDLSVRLPEDGVAELAQLTTTFNNMVARNEAVINELKESEEQSRRFVADVSHELRTPLAALVPVSEILSEEIPNLPADAATAARIVSSEITKLTRLVEDLIEMSRHDSQQARLVLDNIDLVSLTERTLESRGWSDIVELYAPENISARVDSRRIDIVLANLVGNALRHGSPPVRVELGTVPGYAVINVVDHGPGVSPEYRQAIFRRFFKVDTARGRSEGSGLGLSLTVENVRLHGGSIDIDHVDGSTVFTVRLPLN
ncbi:cell wall metabolism sensor histidine kinase WalK [Rhodococcus sp. ARC_M6]|uniref:sensor histidine kinase n=1 Tax=Rhodococcus sp. ARC_M6 TaxID=2928852 RepID=UPI001FB4C0B2|nr:HAMP domain-containing sensor histidine kinase [Rhodococcus sp. ARC_M6]MCJ0905127.1 HAMP domain-containing histidine kinase [Rhodococcus sp. ARC_M6]